MAERHIDQLLALIGDKYKLATVVAKRAVQLRQGRQSVLSIEQRAASRNLVTQAIQELASGKLRVGEHLIDEERLHQDYQRAKQAQMQAQLAAERAARERED